jgi:type II secretory pathway predicted ATPase ExeA
MDMRRLGLLRDPFRELPGAAQPFFINDRFQRAYRDLLAAARTHAALLLLTGEAGVGKSTLLRYLCQTTYLLRGLPFGITVEICPPAQAQPSTQAEKRAEAFAANGAPTTDTSVANPADTWERFRTGILRRDTDTRPILLLVDDAQEMPDPLLQELISLPVESQREGGTLTVVPVGTPDLVPRLVSLGLDPVHQLGASIELFALSDADVNAYVQQALAHAGRCGPELFPPPSIQRIAAISEGNPRRINQLCSAALSAVVAGRAKIVTPEIIADAACQCSFGAVAADTEDADALQDHTSVITNSAPDTIHPTGTARPMPGSRQGADERSFVNSMPQPQSRAQLSQADQGAPSALAGSAAATMSLAAVVPAQDTSAEPTLAWIGRDAASIGHTPTLLRFGLVAAGISALAAVVAWPLTRPYLVPSENHAELPAPSPSLVEPEPSPMPEPARDEPPVTQPMTSARGDSVAAVDGPALESEVAAVPAAIAPEGSALPTPSEESESGNAGERPSTDLTMEQAPAADENARPRTAIGASQTAPLTSPAARSYRPHPADISPSGEGKATRFSASAIIDVAHLLARGNDLMTQSDVVSARLLYGYAVTRGSVAAMTAMGRTYDPVFFTRSGTRGVRPESAKAIEWYERAIDGGDAEAKRHLRDLVLELRDASELDPTQAAALLHKTE